MISFRGLCAGQNRSVTGLDHEPYAVNYSKPVFVMCFAKRVFEARAKSKQSAILQPLLHLW